MRENFHEAFALAIGLEGNETNDPNDPGGHTKFGISKRAHPDVDIGALTIEHAEKIYWQHYWDPAHCDELPWPLDMLMFDTAVNQGVSTAVGLLQKTIGVAQDGLWGLKTDAALQRAVRNSGLPETCALFMADRALRYTGTRNFDRYGRGWFKRLFKICMDKSVSF